MNGGDCLGDGIDGAATGDSTSLTEGYLGSGLDRHEPVRGGGRPVGGPGPYRRVRSSTTARCSSRSRSIRSVPDGSDLLRTYKVKSGDTLGTIADKFDVSMMTLWWANKLKSKNELHIGQQLRIPPVSGVVVEVTPNDTLTGLATKYKVDEKTS